MQWLVLAPRVTFKVYGENVPEAEKLLDEAGWKKGADGFRYKDGKKLAPVIYGIAGFFKEIAEAVQGDVAGHFKHQIADEKYPGAQPVHGLAERQVIEHLQLGKPHVDTVQIGHQKTDH